MTMEIDQSSFLDWQKHPVTQRLMGILTDWDDVFKEQLLNPGFILDPRGQISSARIVGHREVIERILDLNLDDLITEEESDDERVSD